jgi:hypothetical protein
MSSSARRSRSGGDSLGLSVSALPTLAPIVAVKLQADARHERRSIRQSRQLVVRRRVGDLRVQTGRRLPQVSVKSLQEDPNIPTVFKTIIPAGELPESSHDFGPESTLRDKYGSGSHGFFDYYQSLTLEVIRPWTA